MQKFFLLVIVVVVVGCGAPGGMASKSTVFDPYSGQKHRISEAQVDGYLRAGYVTALEYETLIKPDRELVDQAKRLMFSGKYDEAMLRRAIALLSKVGQHPRMKAERFCWVGNCLQLMKDYDGAIAAYSESIAVNPPTAWSYTYYSRGISYLCKSDYVLAEKDFRKAVDIEPGDWNQWGYQVWIALAELHKRTGNDQARQDALVKARSTPNYIDKRYTCSVPSNM